MLNYTENLAEGGRAFNAAAQAVTVTLLSSALAPNKPYRVVKTDTSANAITVKCDVSDTFVGGATSITIPGGSQGFTYIRRGGPGQPIQIIGGAGSALTSVGASLGPGMYFTASGQLMYGAAPNPGNQMPNANFTQIAPGATPVPVGYTFGSSHISLVVGTGHPFSGPNVVSANTNSALNTITGPSIAVNPGDWYFGQIFLSKSSLGAGTVTFTATFYDNTGANLGSTTIVTVTSFSTSYVASNAQFLADPALYPGLATMVLAVTIQASAGTLFLGAIELDDVVTNSVLGLQAVQSANMYANAVNAANGALSAGNYVFSSDVSFCRGSGQPIVYIGTQSGTAGVWLFGASASGGASGLTSQPYVGIQSSQAIFYGGNTGGGGTGSSLTINATSMVFWQVNGSTASPFLQLSSGALNGVGAGIVISDGGSTTLTAYSGSITLLNVSASQQLSVSASGVVASGGSYTLSLSASGGLTLSASGTSGGSVSITASGGVLVQNHAGTSYVQINSSGVAIVGGTLTTPTINGGAISGSSLTIAISGTASVNIDSTNGVKVVNGSYQSTLASGYLVSTYTGGYTGTYQAQNFSVALSGSGNLQGYFNSGVATFSVSNNTGSHSATMFPGGYSVDGSNGASFTFQDLASVTHTVKGGLVIS